MSAGFTSTDWIECSIEDCGHRNMATAEFCARCGKPLSRGGGGAVVLPYAAEPTAIPAIAPDASPEEKDRHWYKYYYQGDKMKQLTPRAVIMGGVLGMLMCSANLYTTLSIGWAFGVAITACVMSYVIWSLMRVCSGNRLTPMSILENNCMQSTASAAGYSTGSTLATAFGALLILEGHHLHWAIVASFTLVTGAMGVFLAIPMKRQMINQEQLPFPSGIAAAETLKSLYTAGREAIYKAYALVAAMFFGMIVGVLRTGEGILGFLDDFFNWMKAHLFNIRIPEMIPAEGFYKINNKQLINFGFEPSVLLIGAGMIVGLRVSLSMLAGSLLLYLYVAPQLIAMDDAGLKADPAYIRSIDTVAGGTIYHLYRWGLWGGTAVMVFASLTSVALQWRTIARSFAMFRKKEAPVSTDAAMAAIEVPTSWLIAGLVPISIAMLLVQYIAFDISLWLGAIAVGMSFVLCLVASRATGETDTTPIGAMGKVMQLLFAVLSPKNITHNLISAGIAANSASSSADLLTDLKSGYLIGANPRKQFLAQFVGIFFGTIAVVPCWFLLVPDKAAIERFPAPATNQWVAVARVLTEGLDRLPYSSKIAILIGTAVGIGLPLIERALPKARGFLPSAMGLGLSWVIPFSNALSFALGAVIAWIWSLAHKRTQEAYNVPIASGLVAGESLMQALIAMTATAVGLIWGRT